jgi:hypothetical protein
MEQQGRTGTASAASCTWVHPGPSPTFSMLFSTVGRAPADHELRDQVAFSGTQVTLALFSQAEAWLQGPIQVVLRTAATQTPV